MRKTVAVVGTREFNNYPLLKTTLDKITGIGCIVSGGAKGADTLAEKYAAENALETVIYLPKYDKYGRGAPLKRNEEIVNASDMVVAFWDGKSRGTANTIANARKKGKALTVINYTNEVIIDG